MDYAVVTLNFVRMGWQYDLELPVKMKIRGLKSKILETLKAHDEDKFEEINNIRLINSGIELLEDMCLLDYNIWDGSVIEAYI